MTRSSNSASTSASADARLGVIERPSAVATAVTALGDPRPGTWCQSGGVDEGAWGDVRDALKAGREAVDSHVAVRAAQGHDSREDALTEILLANAATPGRVRYAQFNQNQEGAVGADWLWWFVDVTGEGFGLLVQAKRLKFERSQPTIDFGYQSGGESQMDKLFRAADIFGVPAAYVLYCGDRSFRGDLTCGPEHSEVTCNLCDRAGVSIIAGLCASEAVKNNAPVAVIDLGGSGAARDAFTASIPLEDLADARPTGLQVADPNLDVVSGELTSFLLTPQAGARQVAKQFFEGVSHVRRSSFSQAAPAPTVVASTPVFEEVPGDTGHFAFPYFEHILRGLRSSLPAAVTALLDGVSEPPAGYEGLAGVAVFEV